MILDIEQDWGKEPGWFATLDAGAQAQLLARRRIQIRPKGK